MSCAEQRDGGQRDIAHGAGPPPRFRKPGPWLSSPKTPNPPAGKNPGACRTAPSSAPLVARRPRPKSSCGSSSLRLPRDRTAFCFGQSVPNPLRLIRAPRRKTPVARSGRFVFRVAPPRRPIAPPQLRSVARATGTLAASVDSSHPRSGARSAAPHTGLVGVVSRGFPGPGRPSASPLPRAVGVFPAPLLGTSKAFHPVGRAHFKRWLPHFGNRPVYSSPGSN